MQKNKIDYANWIPVKILWASGAAVCLSLILLGLSFLLPERAPVRVLRIILGALSAVFALLWAYMAIARRMLSYEGGNVQSRILDKVLGYLDWDGQGELLDIGCGSGALAIKAAKKFPRGRVVGVDYWGAMWDYAQSQCEQNAALEGVAGRVCFQKGDAAKLDFENGRFDAGVSNFVFHEVRTQPDKLELIREALRVLKPGAPFAFEDIFYSKKHYPDVEALIREISMEVRAIHFVDTRKNRIVPAFLKTPLVAGQMGLICGRK